MGNKDTAIRVKFLFPSQQSVWLILRNITGSFWMSDFVGFLISSVNRIYNLDSVAVSFYRFLEIHIRFWIDDHPLYAVLRPFLFPGLFSQKLAVRVHPLYTWHWNTHGVVATRGLTCHPSNIPLCDVLLYVTSVMLKRTVSLSCFLVFSVSSVKKM